MSLAGDECEGECEEPVGTPTRYRPGVEQLHLSTSDGEHLPADVLRTTPTARGALVICHPHPLYGGNRHSPVVDAVFRAAPDHGFHSLRFDFRAAYDEGHGEQLDVQAALNYWHAQAPELSQVLVGYSFGARVAMSAPGTRVAGIVAIAPPLDMPLAGTASAEDPNCPCLILVPAHDQFCPPERVAALTADWADVEIHTIEMADHFFAGRTAALREPVFDWLSRRC